MCVFVYWGEVFVVVVVLTSLVPLFAWVLIECVVCSVLTEHVQRFEPQVGCSQRDSAL